VAALQQPHRAGETIRVFPLSNWTERDVWEYVEREGVEVPSLYFAAPRPTVEREGQIFVVEDERFPLREGERPAERTVRFRTLGCYPLSGAMLSEAATVPGHPGGNGAVQILRAARPCDRSRSAELDGAQEARRLFLVELLRFIICGSVDDGKSTLLGRLLHDCGSLGDDELARLEADSRRFGRCGGSIDYSLLADGLEAEREQANHDRCRLPFLLHRGTAVHRRRRAGHEQYTRNLVTGASTADVAVLLADARTGLVTQTRRHLYLVKLLGVRQVMLAVNKMDLVGYDRDRFEAVREDFSGFAQRIGIGSHAAIPVSAVTGENLSVRSSAMDWYQGPNAHPVSRERRQRHSRQGGRPLQDAGAVGQPAGRQFSRLFRPDRRRPRLPRRPGARAPFRKGNQDRPDRDGQRRSRRGAGRAVRHAYPWKTRSIARAGR
jgi:bifunctional enzyme CysN/CysC